MGHGHDRARILLQGPLQPCHRLGVEVVGGLVQEQEVGLRQEQPAEGYPPPLTARQRRHVGVAGRKPKGVHGDLEGPLKVPGTGGIDLVLQVGLLGQQLVEVSIGLAHGCTHGVEPVDQLFGLAHAVGNVAQDVLARVELGLLGQVPHREAGGQPGLAGESVVLPGHDPEQRGLP